MMNSARLTLTAITLALGLSGLPLAAVSYTHLTLPTICSV